LLEMAKKKKQKTTQASKSQTTQSPKLSRTQDYKHYNVYLVAIILIIVGTIIYSNTFHGTFAFDDYRNIKDNEDIKNNSIYTQFNRQRYIAFVSFAINYYYNEYDSFGYHIVNITIHIINAFLVYLVIQKLLLILQSQNNATYRREIPLLAALLFLVHPLQTQAVSYIVQRMTSLVALFVLLSIYYYLKFRASKDKEYLALILSFFAALLAYKTKENAATLPLMIIAIELILFRAQKITRARIAYILPFFIMIIVIPLSLINVDQPLANVLGEMSKASQETQIITRTQYFLTESKAITTYVRLLILPINQSLDYHMALSKSVFEPATLLSLCFLTAFLILAVVLAKKQPFLSLGILWFFIFLAVESSIIPIKDVIFEHRVYLPSVGFIAAVVYALFLLEDRLHWHKFAFLILAACIITLSVAAYMRNQLYKNEMLLWEDAAIKYPLNARAVGNYGVALANSGNYKEGAEVLKHAIQINPRDSSHWYSLAFCYKMMGEPDQAIAPYQKALELAPQYQKAAVDLSMIYISKHEFTKAWGIMTKARYYYPEHPYNNALIAQLYCETDDLQKAMPLFDKAVKNGLDYADVYFNFAICLLNHRKTKEARDNFFKVFEFNPREIESYYFVAVTYDRDKNYPKSLFFYEMFASKTIKSQWLEEVQQRIKRLRAAGIQPEGQTIVTGRERPLLSP
jgi:protein O-mannosyl-transferase